MTVKYFEDFQIKRILARLRFHGTDERLIDRVCQDINFEVNYENFLRLSNPSKSKLVYDCLQFSMYAHQGQSYRKRSDSQGLHLVPYINHPIILGIKAIELGFDEVIIAGCLVHDTFKATKITEHMILQELDPQISKIIMCFNRIEGETKVEALNRILTKECYSAKAIKVLDKWHSLLRSFTLYDPEYQRRLVDEVTNIVLPQVGSEFGDIVEDCNLFVRGVSQLRQPIYAF
jgi:(p)ppGpp synthase/HD superfamily hydrolase